MLAGVILGMSVLTVAGAPEGLAVLALETKGTVSDVKALQENFSVLVQADVALPIIPGDSLSSLATLLGCVEKDEGCLSQVAGALQVRWVLYASISQKNNKLSLEASLFDANQQKDVATSRGALSSAGDREGLRKVIRDLFGSAETAALRRPAPVDGGSFRPGYAAPVALATAGGVLGGVFLFLFASRNQIDFPGEGRALTALAVAADVSLIAAGASFFATRAKRRKVRASAATVSGGAVLLFRHNTPQGETR